MAPVFRLIIRLIWSQVEQSKEENENEESEDDGDEMLQQIEFELGTNECYTPNFKS